jgi:hypothetical protein
VARLSRPFSSSLIVIDRRSWDTINEPFGYQQKITVMALVLFWVWPPLGVPSILLPVGVL